MPAEEATFYLDGVGFEFKTNPLDQARAPTAQEWRKGNEGLDINCVSRGKKEGRRNANFMVAVSYGKGVIFARQYFGTMDGPEFAKIIKEEFKQAFAASSNPTDKVFLMDGCPRQNATIARNTWTGIGAELFTIPVITRQITKENFSEFSERVKNCMLNFSAKTIDTIIGSMDKRVGLIIKRRGQRIKY